MSGKFNGFTQEDIKRISGKPNRGVGIRRVSEEKTLKIKRETEKPTTIKETANNTSDDSMTSLHEAVHFRPLSSKKTTVTKEDDSCDESILQLSKIQDNCQSSVCMQEPAVETSPFKGVSLKDFESQRKLVEEQNKQKRDLLYKAIQHHSEKTVSELKKIDGIRKELAKLDSELALDVAILRKQIENACLDYHNAQKQFQHKESQYLKAKLDLHSAYQRKELLTEHLCTIITHNEDRKGKKLSELIERCGLSPTDNLS